MNPRCKMLLWEQGRTAGEICLAFCGVSLLLGAVLHYQLFVRSMPAHDAANIAQFLVFGVPAVAAFFLTVRQDGRGHIAGDFEPRLLRLPVPMPVVFTVVIGVRFLCVVVLLLLNSLLLLTFPAPTLEAPPVYLLLPLHLFFVVQSILWSYPRVPVVTDGSLAFTLGLFLLYRFGGGTEDVIEKLLFNITHPAALIAVPPVSIALMAYGVYLERRDEHFGPPTMMEMLKQANHSFVAPSVDAVRSPLEAQLWYENRRIGRTLPMNTLFVTAFLFMSPMIVAGGAVFRSGFGQFLPLIALPFAALAAVVVGRFPRSGYAHLRPVSGNFLVVAHLLAHLRSLLFAMITTGGLSFFFLLAGPAERELLAQSWAAGYTDMLNVFVLIMRPLILVTVVAWCISTDGSVLSLAPFFIIANGLFQRCIFGGINPHDPFSEYVYGSIGIILVVSIPTMFLARLKNHVPAKQFGVQILVCLVIAAFFWLGSSEMKGLPGMLMALTVGVLCVLPITTLTLYMEKQRHVRHWSWRLFD